MTNSADNLETKDRWVAIEEVWGRIVVMDSLARIDGRDQGQVIVTGSHCSDFAARHAVHFAPFGLIANDAGKGKENAGISGLPVLEAMNIPGAAVDCHSARIGEGRDAYQNGVISALNDLAALAGVEAGQSVKEAAGKMLAAKKRSAFRSKVSEVRRRVSGRILLADSLSQLDESHRGAVVVSGSHCAKTTYDWVASLDLAGVLLNDAGGGKDQAGISGLPRYQKAGIPAAAVDCLTARIGDAGDAWENGRVSAANSLARGLGVRPGMPVSEAAYRFLQGRGRTRKA